ncbi:MAG: hypothetical protein K9M45_11545 [Kiritimatiellales bacterium]|nr:hypothetical protein [Kiritimatiellales bacterium]
MRSRIIGIVAAVFCLLSSGAWAEKVPTDFKAQFVPLETLKQKMATHGLEVLGTHAVAGDEDYISIVYTSGDLRKLGQLPGRGFISVLSLLYNKQAKEIVASNPEYFVRAFMQKEYEDGMAKPVSDALRAALGELTPTDDSLEAKKLAKYHFMMSMPYYDDFVRVAKGSTKELCGKLEAGAKEQIVFKLDVATDGSSVLYGVALPVEIEKFNDTLETMGQSHLLPYLVLVENGEANILHAKFYLAVSFPRLTMTEFMKIMSTPGKIEDSCKNLFQ